MIHAAALKQVPVCEYNSIEAVKTNIDGAMNIVNAVLDSDSVIATNSYAGARDVRFSVVRYGNVAGSRGSVIPLLKTLLTMVEKNCQLQTTV